MAGTFSRMVAATVRAELARHEVSQGQLADLLGVSTTQAGKRLRGVIAYTVDELGTIAAHLGIPVSVFVADSERVA